MTELFIGLGSNLGNREGTLEAARVGLAAYGRVRLTACSPLVETEPWGDVPQGWYLNQVCRAETELPLHDLMHWLQAVERQGGRDRSQEKRWGARPIDIDLLAYGTLEHKDDLVEVPHPRLHLRRFVLQPWTTIAPNWLHPRLGLTVTQMLAEVDDDGVVKWYGTHHSCA